MVKENWLPMFENPKYKVNRETGEIKSSCSNYKDKILKGRIMRYKNGRAKCKYYVITYPDGTKKTKKGSHIVAEAVLKKDLSGISISHKILTLDDSYENLIIGERKKGHCGKKVVEYYRGEYRRVYPSIRNFESITGLSHHSFKKVKGERVRECGPYTFIIVE